jgi:hypothetical protein
MTPEISTTRRWSTLIVSLATTLCANVFINGVVFLLTALKAERHMDLAEGALWSAMPSLGMAAGSLGPMQTSSRYGRGKSHVHPHRPPQRAVGRPLNVTDDLYAPRSGHELAKYRPRLHPRELRAQA